MHIDREEVIRRFRESDTSARAAVHFRELESEYMTSMGTLALYGELYSEPEYYTEVVRGSLAKEQMDKVVAENHLVIAQSNPDLRAGGFVRYDPKEHRVEVDRGEKFPKKGEVLLIKNSSIAVREGERTVTLLEPVVCAVPAEMQTSNLPLE